MAEVLEHPERVVSGIYRYQHKNGSIKVLEVTRQQIRHCEPRRDSSVIVHARDITDQSLAERALKESEERLRDFAEMGADWFWEQDAALRFTYLSGNYPGSDSLAIDNVIGKTREEIAKNNNFKSEKWKRLAARLENREPFHNFEYTRNSSITRHLTTR
jgi:PAS domain-containing protein